MPTKAIRIRDQGDTKKSFVSDVNLFQLTKTQTQRGGKV